MTDTNTAERITDEMVHAALKAKNPTLYRDHLRHPSNGPVLSASTENEIQVTRKMLEAAFQAGRASLAASAGSEPVAAYSIDADPQGIRSTVADAITGALAFGAQGVNQPPGGHWLAPFWNAAREDKAARQPVGAAGSEPVTQDLDAWKCEHCHGKGWRWQSESVNHGKEIGVENVDLRTHCDACEGIGWCGPDAERAATAAKQAAENELKVRGYLAATLKCWHRLTGIEAAELVAMTQRLSGLYTHPSPPEGMAGWISVDERLPEVGVTVLVYEPFRHGEDWPGTVRISFDHICPDYEGWHDHCASYEHFMAVGGVNACGPDVTCTGPSEKAPYTHWQPLPAPPLPASAKEL